MQSREELLVDAVPLILRNARRSQTRLFIYRSYIEVPKLPRENNLEENPMTRKLSLIAAVAAAALLIPAGAFAGGRMHDGWRGDHWRGDRGRGDHWRGDRGRGHWYHGRWWGYGEGRCWRRTPVGWVWICGD